MLVASADDGFVLGWIVGVVFGMTVTGVACWFFERRRFDQDYARILALVKYEACRSARETVARLVPERSARGTVSLKLPMEERPTIIREE